MSIVYCNVIVLFVCKTLLDEAQAKLTDITHDQSQYKSILESLLVQVTTACRFFL